MEIMYFKENGMSMEDSFVYNTFKHDNDIVERMTKVMRSGISIDKSAIEEQYLQISKSYMSPLAKNVLAAFDNGHIEIFHNGPDVKIPQSIPFIVRKDGADLVASIFITSYINGISPDGNSIDIEAKKLYAIMETAYIALNMYINPAKMQKNTTLQRLCAEIYTDMLLRILSKEYALNLNKELNDSVSFSISKFFLTNIWGATNKDVIYTYASALCLNPNHTILEEVNASYDSYKINDIKDLLEFLRTMSPRLRDLQIQYFLERFINTYGPPALLSIDYLPYLIFVIVNTRLGSYVLRHNAISDIVRRCKNINAFYPELAKLY